MPGAVAEGCKSVHAGNTTPGTPNVRKKKLVTGTRKPPPRDAAEKIRELAAAGWSKIGIGRQLGASNKLLNVWMDTHPELQDAFDEGRDREHNALYDVLFNAATKKGDTTAAMFLLKCRHGYREGTLPENFGPSLVIFGMPGSAPAEKWVSPAQRKVIEHE